MKIHHDWRRKKGKKDGVHLSPKLDAKSGADPIHPVAGSFCPKSTPNRKKIHPCQNLYSFKFVDMVICETAILEAKVQSVSNLWYAQFQVFFPKPLDAGQKHARESDIKNIPNKPYSWYSTFLRICIVPLHLFNFNIVSNNFSGLDHFMSPHVSFLNPSPLF